MFKVSEIAEKLGKSNNSVYKKTNRLKVELKPHRNKLNGVIYYDSEGFDIIKNSYSNTVGVKSDVKSMAKGNEDKYLELLLLEKNEQISHLKEQLAKHEESLEQAMKLVENNQILLLKSQEQVLMLESAAVDEKKGFWYRLKNGKKKT